MENNANQLNMLCKKNCGFFGNAAYDGYCSKCYKDHVKRQNTGSAAGRVTPTGLNSSSTTSVSQISTVNTNINEIPVSSSIQQTTTTTVPQIVTASSNLSTNEFNTVTTAINESTNTINQNTFAMPASIPSNSSSSSSSSSSVPIPIPSKRSNENDTVAMSVPSDMSTSLLSTTSTSPLGAASIGDNSLSGTSLNGEKKKRSRCVLESCKRKVGLTGFDCRCGGLYCWEHRYSDKHDCKFDYKELGQDQIRKNNPIVVGEKIQKI